MKFYVVYIGRIAQFYGAENTTELRKMLGKFKIGPVDEIQEINGHSRQTT